MGVKLLKNTFIQQNSRSWAEDDSNAFIHETWNYKYLIWEDSDVLKTGKLNEIHLRYHMVLGGHSTHKYNFTSLDI